MHNLQTLADFFGTGNPVWCHQVRALAHRVSLHINKSTVMYGCANAFCSEHGANALASFPPLQLPDHVFPIVAETEPGKSLGLVVPVSAIPREQWHLSDAFGRFGRDCDSVATSFEWLLEVIEANWRSKWGAVLPLRWKQPFAFQVLAPVHLESIDGMSLQWPLTLALLRAAASGGDVNRLPFGRGPIFATGTVHPSGAIGWVRNTGEKLCGFCREFGTDRPVLLTSVQRRELEATEGAHRRWLSRLSIQVINGLHALFDLPEFVAARDALTAPPRATELDQFMMAMERDDAGIRFQHVANMVEWLLPAAKLKPAYAFRLHEKRGQVRLHRGDAPAAREDWEAMDDLLEQHQGLFGVGDRIRLAAAWGVYWMDAWEPEDGLRRLDSAEIAGNLQHADLATRAEWHGVAAELSRISGNYDRAVAEGRCALRIAEAGHGRLVGRMANHTVHALICRARAGQSEDRDRDLREARDLLDRSMREYAPHLDLRAREFQLGFCRPLEAELHRLAGLPYEPVFRDARLRIWDHPHLFTLLSAARNPANEPLLRQQCATQLCLGSEAMFSDHKGAVFALLAALYGLVRAQLNGQGLEAYLGRVEAVLKQFPALSGWQRNVQPAIDGLRSGTTDFENQMVLNELCDRVPYH